MKNMGKFKLKEKLPIIFIIVLTAIINVWNLWKQGFANLYYSAGVYSMGQNLHAFLFNSIDSVGFISIDKPPLGLWIQVFFTKIFGFNGIAILLPEALAAIFSVYFIYKIIDKRFARTAAIISALVLSLTPIFVAVSRNNTIDSLLIFVLVLASWQAILAAEKSSFKHLLLSSILIALGFNIKSLQAYMILPSVYLSYLVFSNEKFLKKISKCLISVLVLVLISFSWIIMVDLVPIQNRPYVGSSKTNSQLELTLGNNGLGRLIGHNYQLTNIFKKTDTNNNQQEAPRDHGNIPQENNSPNLSLRKPPQDRNVSNDKDNLDKQEIPRNLIKDNTNKNGGGGESGETSTLRLFKYNNAGQIAWFIFPATVTTFILVILIIKKQLRSDNKYVSLFYFSMCFIPMLIYFSYSGGVVHRYYFAMLAFPIASLIGIGSSFIKNNKTHRLITVIVFLITAIIQIYIQSLYRGWIDWLLFLYIVLLLLVFITLVISTKINIRKIVLKLMLPLLLIFPFTWSLTPIIYGDNSQIPISGPELINQNNAFSKHPDFKKLITYLNKNRDGETYLAAAPSAMTMGAELILQSGQPVMILGGFNGGDETLTIEEFVKLIDDGEIKYAVLPNNQTENTQKQSTILSWIKENCLEVDEVFDEVTLYQLDINKNKI